MDTVQPVATVLASFQAVEQREDRRLGELLHPDVEFLWPPVFPFGGARRGLAPRSQDRLTWSSTWEPLQPTAQEQRMDPRVVAASDSEVVVLWHQRGLSPSGERIDTPVLGLYEVRDGKLVRAQMFYFDAEGAAAFLERARN